MKGYGVVEVKPINSRPSQYMSVVSFVLRPFTHRTHTMGRGGVDSRAGLGPIQKRKSLAGMCTKVAFTDSCSSSVTDRQQK
jgi:hypothetical protein